MKRVSRSRFKVFQGWSKGDIFQVQLLVSRINVCQIMRFLLMSSLHDQISVLYLNQKKVCIALVKS